MDQEWNNLETDNLKTDFSNDVDNLETSDELEASAVYVNKPDTLYARKKRTKTIIVASSLTLLVTSAGITVGTLVTNNNNHVSNPPTLSEVDIHASEEIDSLIYTFTVANPQNYLVTFYLKINNETWGDIIDCSESITYEGSIDGIGYNVVGTYFIEFSKDSNYKEILLQDTFTTIEEAN